MNNSHYSPQHDNAAANACSQGVDTSLSVEAQQTTKYPCVDNLQNATVHDDKIYISTHDAQHEKIAHGETLDGSGMTLSGYFTSEDTSQNWINKDGTFDSYGYHRDLCVMPYSKSGEASGATDKPHLDCFYIDRDRLEQIYGTRDFNAAIGKCNANNQYGPDGGDQGYNACLNELYNNGCLKYAGTYNADPSSITKCKDDYADMKQWAADKSNAIISGKGSDDIQNMGYPLDSRCHQKTSFNASAHADLSDAYRDYKPNYNEGVANATKNEDRLYHPALAKNDWNNSLPSHEKHSAGPSSNEISLPRKSQSTDSSTPAGPASIDKAQSVSPAERITQNNSITTGPAHGADSTASSPADAAKRVAQDTDNLTALSDPEIAPKAAKSVAGGIT